MAVRTYFQITDLEANYGSFRLGPLSLEMQQNEYLVILGPTGCGKTCLLQSIAGTYRVEKGQILIDGHDIGGLPPQKRNIGYVTQMGDLFPHLTVKENVAFGLSYQSLTRAEKQARVTQFWTFSG